MSESNTGRQAIRLMQELRDSVGQEVRQAADQLGWSVYTFQRNFAELRRFLIYLTEDPEAERLLLPLRHRDLLNEALREMMRLLHNFVTASMSLVWHTTRLRHRMHRDPSSRLHRDPEMDDEVSRRVLELFVNDPLAQFVQKLRAFSQKVGIPVAGFQISQANPEDPIVRRIYLPVSQLLEWDGWNAQARKYLESIGDRVFVAEAIEEYERRVAEFYVWFEDHFRALYSEELADFSRREWELVTLELGSSVNMELRVRSEEKADESFPRKRDEVFAQVFSSTQFAEIEGLADGPGRGERAIAILERMGVVPEELKESIRTLYGM